MATIRFCKFTHTIILATLAFYSIATQAGTISVTPTTGNAGTTGINVISNTKLYYTIKNIGTTNLQITSVTGVSASEFLVQQPTPAVLPITILPGGIYVLTGLFKPAAAGTRNGSYTILSNDPINPSTVVTATGIGGIEQSIRLTPLTPFEIELGQGSALRANVTFTNGATGVALVNWTSSNAAVATVAAIEPDISFGFPVSSGNVKSVALGTTTITASAVQTPAVTASVAITIVSATPHEFMGSAINDRVVRVKNGAWSLCYDFPEADINNRPIYDANELAVTTPSLNTIGDVYLSADNTTSLDASEQLFFIKNCGVRTTVFDQPLALASFRDIVVESTGNAIASNTTGSDLWQVTPTTSFPISRTGLPVDDIGALAIDSFDNLYMANLIKSTNMQTAAVYVRPFGTSTWFPIAAVFGTLNPSSASIPGMAAIYEGNKGYAMKLVAFDKAVVERYVDLNGDGSFYKIVGGNIVADPGEIVEVAIIDAGVNITVDASRSLIASTAETVGRTIVKMTDKNNDGDFKDAGEYKVIYQSTLFTRLKDIAFAAPCGDKPPTSVITTVPADGTVGIGVPLYLLGIASSDPCKDALTYLWTDDDSPATPVTLCTTNACSVTYTGLPALHTVGLKVTDPAGQSNKTTKVVKAGPPVLNGFWPGNGVTNTGVFLFGKNFKVAPVPPLTLGKIPVVKFNGGTLQSFVVQVFAPDLLYALQPLGTVQGKITVTTDMGVATTPVDYNQPPTTVLKINGLWPGETKANGFVFVFGQAFGSAPGSNVVKVNGALAPLVQVLDTTLIAFLVPGTSTTGPVTVTTAGITVASPTNLVILP